MKRRSLAGGGGPPPPAPSKHTTLSQLRLADGVELLGEYQGSGLRQPVYLARRPDGQVVQLSRLLYLVASKTDGIADAGHIARALTEDLGRELDAEGVDVLVQKLQPLGVLAGTGEHQVLPRARQFTGLTARGPVVPARAVRAAANLLRPLFLPPVVLLFLCGLLTFDTWLALEHHFLPDVGGVLMNPAQLLVVYGATVLAMAFHELGHAAAARYGGGEPGPIGAGIYFLTPVFYTDVTDSYRLDRRSRLRVDLGGLYFNAILILAFGGLYFVTGFRPFLLAAVIQHFQAGFQLIPFIRLDGYYLLSDLVGVPDLFARMKPILSSLVRQRSHQRVAELKPSARRTIMAWAVLTNLLFVAGIALTIAHGPKVAAAMRTAIEVDLRTLPAAFRQRAFGLAAVTLWHLLLLSVPLAGITVFLLRAILRRARRLARLVLSTRFPTEAPMAAPADDVPSLDVARADPCLDLGTSVNRILATAAQEAEAILARARAAEERTRAECDTLLGDARRQADELVERGRKEYGALQTAKADLGRQLNQIEAAARALRLGVEQGSSSPPTRPSPDVEGTGTAETEPEAHTQRQLWVPATLRTVGDLAAAGQNGHGLLTP